MIGELDRLIEVGTAADRKPRPKMRPGYFSLVRDHFLHGLNFPEDANYQGDQMSQPVYDHQMIMMRNSWYGHQDITLSEQVARTLGLLQGMRSAYRARAGVQ